MRSFSRAVALSGAAVLLLLTSAAQADVQLPRVFGSHMVLQRDQPIPVWGTAAVGEAVTVTLGATVKAQATADAAGKWMVKLPAQPTGEPTTLTVAGNNTVTFDDVLLGEVWVCSGQSNMQMTVNSCLNAAAEMAAGDHPKIRQFGVQLIPEGYPGIDVRGAWTVCTPQTVGGYTACGYFMARELQQQLGGVPVGILATSWGGTKIEPWVAPEGFALVPELKPLYDQVQATNPATPEYKDKLNAYLTALEAWMAKARQALPANQPLDPAPAYPADLLAMNRRDSPQQQSSTLYHGMIWGLVPYGIRGAIWYQGESNHGETKSYTQKMAALIGGWRKLWGQGDFPFYFVQIAPFNYGAEAPNVMPEFWEAQINALHVPNTGMVVTNDIADYNDIHPKNKQEVGRRLALLALKGAHGKTDVVADGPTFKSLKADGAQLRVEFDNVGGGLASRDGKPLSWFQIVGEGTEFEDATATIDGNTVVLTSPKVPAPVAVQYAWSKTAETNFQNKEGLPARPFRAGEVPRRDYLTLRVPEAKDYTLVYDLDLHQLGATIKYDVDDRAKVTGKFDRIAYFMELGAGPQVTKYVYVSMDAFTDDLGKIGIPTLDSGASFQTKVGNATVISNVDGLVNGTGLQTCNIEFWPNNYGPANAAGIPGADGGVWDFGDERADPQDGYGCMQVHNFGAKQTLFAINQWKGGDGADIGFGNSGPQNNQPTRDWTFAANAKSWQSRRLRVLVHQVK